MKVRLTAKDVEARTLKAIKLFIPAQFLLSLLGILSIDAGYTETGYTLLLSTSYLAFVLFGLLVSFALRKGRHENLG